jgi:hypothetical protein
VGDEPNADQWRRPAGVFRGKSLAVIRTARAAAVAAGHMPTPIQIHALGLSLF